MEFKTLKELYEHSVSAFASRPSFSMYEGEGMTYAQFGERTREVQQTLLSAGLKGGDKVALLSGNMPGWGVAYFAVVTMGMIIVPILPDFSGPELDKIIAHSDARALIVSDRLYSKISAKTLGAMNIVIRSKNLGVIARNVTEPGAAADPAPDDVAAIIYTSGTTSKPKGVMLMHHNLCRQLEMVLTIQLVQSWDIFLSVLPLSHTYECSFGMLLPFRQGASVVYLERPPTASSLMPALKAVRPTHVLSVPLIIEKIYRSQVLARFTRKKVSSVMYNIPLVRKAIHRVAGSTLKRAFGGRLRFFGVGGAKLDIDTERFLAEAKFPYAIGYGLTETAPLIAGAGVDLTRLGSTGPAMKGVQVRLENVNAATGEGEIVVLSPSTMKGYYKNPEATKEVFTPDGWFRTKDLGNMDPDGYLYIRGRLNNMIVGPSGENIYPEEIENVINGHFLVTDSIVKEEKGHLVALVHFNREEMERRYQHLKEEWGYKMDEIKSELMQYVNSKVSKFSRISVVEEQASEFEKTPTHKIKRFLYIKNKKGHK
ncbi:MAG: AMP-binding protein [Rikenellaceae bacterium]|jgi:long-chain acyl-CoA synthetase|nr:AMP-binding protein [Rikenellaceae bacterium]